MGNDNRRKKQKSKKTQRTVPTSGLMSALKASLVASVATVLLMLAVALAIKSGILGEDAIPAINIVLKVVGIAFASWLSVRTTAQRPWFRGGLAGLLYISISIIVFTVFVGEIGFSASTALDIAMGLLVGSLVGVIFGKRA